MLEPTQAGQELIPEFRGKWFVCIPEYKLYLRQNGELLRGAADFDSDDNVIFENTGYFDTKEEALAAIKKFHNRI